MIVTRVIRDEGAASALRRTRERIRERFEDARFFSSEDPSVANVAPGGTGSPTGRAPLQLPAPLVARHEEREGPWLLPRGHAAVPAAASRHRSRARAVRRAGGVLPHDLRGLGGWCRGCGIRRRRTRRTDPAAGRRMGGTARVG